MIRTWKLLCLPALLAVTLTATPVRAADPELDKSDTKKILEMLKQIQDDNAKLRRDLNRQQDDNERQQRLSDNRDTNFEKRLRILENKLEEMERKAAPGRISNYPPNSDPAAITPEQARELQARLDRLERMQISPSFTPEVIRPALPIVTMGTVWLQNNSPFTATVTINGAAYMVFPGQPAAVKAPAGAVTYEVVSSAFGFLRRNTIVLPANGERILTIN